MSSVSVNTEDYNYVLRLIQLLQISRGKAHCEDVSDSMNLFKLNSTLLKRADVFKYCYKALNNKNNSLDEAASYSDLLGEKDK